MTKTKAAIASSDSGEGRGGGGGGGGAVCKRLSYSADGSPLREAVLSAAGETGCPRHVWKRE